MTILAILFALAACAIGFAFGWSARDGEAQNDCIRCITDGAKRTKRDFYNTFNKMEA